MSKKFFAILTILVIILGVSSSLVLAKNDKSGDIPDKDGTYDVLGHPELKVRVFVHKTKPGPSPQPTLRCNLPDPASEAVVDSAGWKLPNSWTYNLNPSSVPSSVGKNNLPTITANSFQVWRDAINNQVTLIRGQDTTVSQKKLDKKNIIAWGAAPSSALGVTYIWYYPSTGQVVEVDTIMNKNFFWMWSDPSTWKTQKDTTCAYTNSYDAQDILTHELGHWMGLDDEYTLDYVNNTMYGYGSKMETKADTLTAGDIDGVEAIY